MLGALPHTTVQIITTAYKIKIFFGSDLDIGFVLLVVQREVEVDCTYVASIMKDLFL